MDLLRINLYYYYSIIDVELDIEPFPLLHFFLDFGKNFSSENLRLHKRNVETKILEPVSSSSRRVARAAYCDKYPRDFGPRITYTVS